MARTVSTPPSRPAPEGAARRRAFTVVELLVAATVSGIVLTGVLATTVELARSSMRVTHYADMDMQVRRAFEQLGVDLKAASNLTWNSATDITVTVPRSDGTSEQFTYAWSSSTETFYRVPGASSASYTGRRDLIRGIPSAANGGTGLAFARLDSGGNATSSDAATKRLQISLTVSRNVGTAAKTRTVAATVFTLRNKPAS